MSVLFIIVTDFCIEVRAKRGRFIVGLICDSRVIVNLHLCFGFGLEIVCIDGVAGVFNRNWIRGSQPGDCHWSHSLNISHIHLPLP